MDYDYSDYDYPLERPQPQPRPRPLILVRSSRGIKIRLKRRVARYLYRASRALTRLCTKLRGLSRVKLGSGQAYARVGEEKFINDCVQRAPKGHLTVYVGPTDAAMAERMVVPLIYINHPLFKKLLDAVEEKNGFDHPGGLTIPCTVSEFETVKTRIAMGRA